MTHLPDLIEPTSYRDMRGELFAYPNLSLLPVVRMYVIRPENTTVIRAWQGHRYEKKWFYPASGAFEVKLIPLNGQGQPQPAAQLTYHLSATEPQQLAIPGGYLNGFKALEAGSTLIVFSDFDLEASKADDFRFGLDSIPWKTEKHG